MSVLIKGVTMPKSCGYCFFATSCDKWRLKNWGSPPPPDCPLVPVPPHGDLVERNALLRAMPGEEMVSRFAVSNAPTIIEAEE